MPYLSDKNGRKDYFLVLLMTLFAVIMIAFSRGDVTITNISTCGELNISDTIYNLTNDVSVAGTCFTINATNITLIGNGFTATFSNGTTSSVHGIDINYGNTTIRNLKITPNTGGSRTNGFAINIISTASGNMIINNTITTKGQNGYGIQVLSENNTIVGNVITTDSGSGASNAFGIKINGQGNIIENNTITSGSTGSNTDYGISVGANFNNITRNSITTYGTNNQPITDAASGVTNILIQDNNLTGLTGTNIAIIDISGSNDKIFGNNITMTANNLTDGIRIYKTSGLLSNNEIANNTIKVGSNGIEIKGGASTTGNVFRGNNIIIVGNGHGIYLTGGGNHNASFYDMVVNVTRGTGNDTSIDTVNRGVFNYTNVTLLTKEFLFDAGSNVSVNVQWYVNAYVNSSNGSSVIGSNVTASDSSGTSFFLVQTDATGNIAKQTLLDYRINRTAKVISNNYTLNASFPGYDTISRNFLLNASRSENFQLSPSESFEFNCYLNGKWAKCFNDSLLTGNLTFAGNNITRYLEIPKRANVTYSAFNLSGISKVVACFQETANQSSSSDRNCELTYVGNYLVTYGWSNNGNAIYDGNWSSFDQSASGSNYYVNYTVPYNALTALWQVKDGDIVGNTYTNNLTIPSTCWNANLLQLRGYDSGLNASWYCKNDTDWQLLRLTNNAEDALYEESIIWNVSIYPISPYLEIGSPDGVYEWSLRNAEFQGSNAILRKMNDSLSIKNLTFTGSQDQTIYVQIPKYASVINATLNISSYISSVYTYCYQETANISVACGGLGTGNYGNNGTFVGIQYYYDGDWGTNGYPSGEGTHTIYINYTKPSLANNQSKIKIGSDYGSGSFLIPSSCWALNPLQFRYSATIPHLGIPTSTFGCWDSLNYIQISALGSGAFYEEAMEWNISNYASNITFRINNSANRQIYNYSGNFDLTDIRINDFSLNLTSYKSSCPSNSENYCIVPLVLHSDSIGIIGISDIFINYTNVSRTLDLSSTINRALSNSACSEGITNANNCSVPFLFRSDANATLLYNSINVTYFTNPNVTLISPANNSVVFMNKTFVCNVTDDSLLVNITLFIWNSTNSVYNSTTTPVTGYSNFSSVNINFSYSDIFKWNCLGLTSNSSAFSGSNYTVIVDISSPAITQNTPSAGQWFNRNNNIDFNCTAEGANLNSIFLYGTFGGIYAKNSTINSITSGTTNNFRLNLLDNSYNWTCAINRSNSATIQPSQNGNFTVNIDTIYPNVSIDYITITGGSQTISFNPISQDRNAMTCKYSIFNSLGAIDGLNNNVSFTCNTVTSATVSSYATYNLTVYSKDPAGNENFTVESFTTVVAPPTIITTGGGGGIPSFICDKNYTTWRVTSEYGAGYKEIFIAPKGERNDLYVKINNLGTKKLNLNIKCADLNNSRICPYINIPKPTIGVEPTGKEVFAYYSINLKNSDAKSGEVFYAGLIVEDVNSCGVQFPIVISVSRIGKLYNIVSIPRNFINGNIAVASTSIPIWLVALLLLIIILFLAFLGFGVWANWKWQSWLFVGLMIYGVILLIFLIFFT